MLYTPLTKRVMRYCFDAHAGQVDKCGIPYVHHPLHLAESMRTEDEVCAALLHDVMEDCGKTPDDLRKLGVSERVLQALLLLTHAKDVPYLDYVRALKDDELARAVKIADLRHNSTVSRLDTVTAWDVQRLRKYMEARVILGDLVYSVETAAGSARVAVNGEPYPFAVVEEHGLENVGRSGAGDCSRWIEIDVSPLRVGDEVAIVGECTIDMQICGYFGCAYAFDCATGAYRIVEDPLDHRYSYREHTIGVRVR